MDKPCFPNSVDSIQIAPSLSAATVTLARAGWRDLAATRELEKVCFGSDAWGYFELVMSLLQPGRVQLKATQQSQVVGLVIGDSRPFERVGWIANICVHPDHQRQGIAKALLSACEAALPQPVIKLTVRKSNSQAIALYQQLGYKQVTVWANYYSGGEAGLVMEKAKRQ